jgi:hypothetical protein
VTADRPQARDSWTRAVVVVLAHPSLWSTALRQAVRLTPADWWRRPPFLPLPDRAYLRFRLETQYGTPASPDGASPDGSAPVDADDVLTYLRWCRDQERFFRGTRAGALRSRR